ncbi:type II toxin-antitoxin system HigB family toxin, partial [Paraburkholderia sp. BR10937]|uniref:type II toxin-antitoxin system HigB family toxin n=1 Tax=Paraburkholderia sp. BR10937 TaxID=3236994 RepID=UPI0034D2ED89
GLKKTFGTTVDYVPTKFYVFYVGGNKLRVVATLQLNPQKLFISHFLKHKENDQMTRNKRRK